MIKISKMGEMPQQKKFKKIYHFTCSNCKMVFTCDKKDLTDEVVGHGEIDEMIFCPLCHEKLYYRIDGFAETVEVEE